MDKDKLIKLRMALDEAVEELRDAKSAYPDHMAPIAVARAAVELDLAKLKVDKLQAEYNAALEEAASAAPVFD